MCVYVCMYVCYAWLRILGSTAAYRNADFIRSYHNRQNVDKYQAENRAVFYSIIHFMLYRV